MYKIIVLSGISTIIGLLLMSITTFAQTYQWPILGGTISDSFGTRNGKHYGIDIAAPEGTPVSPIQGGIVSRSYTSESYGEVIFVKHEDGYESVYAHLQERYVKEGDQVTLQTTIGTVGNTGHSHGNHLHLEVHKGKWTYGKFYAINPLLLIEEPTESVVVSAPAQSDTYVVRTGDTLYSIARRFGISLQTLKKENNLSTDLIFPGQMLFIIR